MTQAKLPEPWPFDQAANVAAITSRQVLEGQPITHIYHMVDDDSWVFLHAAGMATEDGRVIGMGEAYQIDPSIVEVADMQPGWIAARISHGMPWSRIPDSNTSSSLN